MPILGMGDVAYSYLHEGQVFGKYKFCVFTYKIFDDIVNIMNG